MVTATAAPLTPTAERRIRRASTGFVVFVALSAAILSFAGLYKLAITAGFHPWIAWLFPLATDVAVAAFSLTVLHHSLSGLKVWYAWSCMILGVGVSIAGNVWAAPDDLMSRLTHSWPPLIFALSFEALTRLIRYRIHHGADTETTVARAASPAPVAADLVVQQQTFVPEPPTQISDAPAPAVDSTLPAPPTPAAAESSARPLKDRVLDAVLANPDATHSEIARLLNADRSTVSRYIRQLRTEHPDLLPEGEA